MQVVTNIELLVVIIFLCLFIIWQKRSYDKSAAFFEGIIQDMQVKLMSETVQEYGVVAKSLKAKQFELPAGQDEEIEDDLEPVN